MSQPNPADLIVRYATAPTLDALPVPISVDGAVPPNPPQKVQEKFVGLSYEGAYQEAASFVEVVDQFVTKHLGEDLGSVSRLLDFGSGWGRITRMLLARTEAERIYAADVDLEMTALVNATLPGVNALTVDSTPPTILGAGSMGGVVSFSVFSHLSGPAHEAWAAELGRLVRPGGFAAITVLDGKFFEQLAAAHAAVARATADDFARALADVFPDLDAARQGYELGEIQYAAVGGGGVRSAEYYGWAVAPSAYIDRVWGAGGFRVVEWVPSGVLFQQALVFMVKQAEMPVEMKRRRHIRFRARR